MGILRTEIGIPNWEGHLKHSLFSYSFLALVAGTLAPNPTAFATEPPLVLVIDEGVDFQSKRLEDAKHLIVLEAAGHPGIDDNGDSFLDNVSGWNHISQDATYMPDYLLRAFTADPQQTRSDLETYSGIEKNDPAAIAKYSNDPGLQNRIGQLLQFAHGTHVAGIVAGEAQNTARIHSLNIFSPSSEPVEGQSSDLGILAKATSFKMLPAEDILRSLPKGLAKDPTKEEFKSIFDNKVVLDYIAAQRNRANKESNNRIAAYIKAVKPKVVNMSFAIPFLNIVDRMLQVWTMELKEAGLPLNTVMTKQQRQGLVYLAGKIFTDEKSSWLTLMASQPEVLFVVAAGNDGRGDGSDYGNLDVYDSVPASLAEFLPNVITVVATNHEGILADFSSFSVKRSQVGAPGVAIQSDAPAANEVAMSGTSMAAPYVSGISARAFALNPKLRAADIKLLLMNTVSKTSSLATKTATGGMVSQDNFFGAVLKSQTMGFYELLRDLAHENSAASENTQRFSIFTKIEPIINTQETEDLIFRTPKEVREIIKRFF